MAAMPASLYVELGTVKEGATGESLAAIFEWARLPSRRPLNGFARARRIGCYSAPGKPQGCKVNQSDSDQGPPLAGPAERDRLLAELYDELRAAASRLLRRDAPFLTLEPTDLVNEAALRVMKLDSMSWQDRQHFFATGARILRQAMIDAIRRRRSAKRHVPTLLFADEDSGSDVDVEALDAAVTRLEAVSPELARIVELRFFVGLGVTEIAAVTETSESTIKRRWRTARLWLAAELAPDAAQEPER
ncbi:MAG TPA: ECF-type sigma factor [Allosphingosinicella sp.]|nr:ECF-type sigma factor [Allosphingosinicella sp.]